MHATLLWKKNLSGVWLVCFDVNRLRMLSSDGRTSSARSLPSSVLLRCSLTDEVFAWFVSTGAALGRAVELPAENLIQAGILLITAQ